MSLNEADKFGMVNFMASGGQQVQFWGQEVIMITPETDCLGQANQKLQDVCW